MSNVQGKRLAAAPRPAAGDRPKAAAGAQAADVKSPKGDSKASAPTEAAAPAKAKGWAAKGGGAGRKAVDGFAEVRAPKPSTAEAMAPAVTRALLSLSEATGAGLSREVALEAAREFISSPEAMTAFRHAMPYLTSSAGAVAGATGTNLAKTVLPLLSEGKAVRAVLDGAAALGGPQARRLVGAAIRGLNTGGGMAGAAAELAATSAKMAAKSGALGSAAGLVGKALPVVGNGFNLLALGGSLKALKDVMGDPSASTGTKLSRVLHVAATVTACFVPPAALVAAGIDVATARRA